MKKAEFEGTQQARRDYSLRNEILVRLCSAGIFGKTGECGMNESEQCWESKPESCCAIVLGKENGRAIYNIVSRPIQPTIIIYIC